MFFNFKDVSKSSLNSPPCHCIHDPETGWTIARGIECTKWLGVELMQEEDYHDGAPWAEPDWCTCFLTPEEEIEK